MSDLYKFKLRESDAPQSEPRPAWNFEAAGAQVKVFVGTDEELIATDHQWGSDEHEHGSETTMQATLANHDGSYVRFVVEHEENGEWKPYATVPGTVKDGKAVAALRVHHPSLPPVGEPPHPSAVAQAQASQLRFRVEKGIAPPQVAALPASVATTHQPPPAPEPAHGEIPVGSAIAPPKLMRFIADKDAEVKWFAKLQRITPAQLQPGDILLRKKWDGGPVVVAQKLFQAEKASKFTSHAMIYLGEGKIAHAYEVPMAVAVSEVPDFDMIVWRAVDAKAAAAAAATAKWMVATGKMNYSVEDCMGTAFASSEWGPDAEGRANLVAQKKLPTDRTMCSEFVSYCYQSSAGKPDIKIDAKRTCPMRLEDYLNRHPEAFRFGGAIHSSGDTSKNSTIDMSKVMSSVGGELKENFIHLAGQVTSAAQAVSSGAKKLGSKLKKLL